MTRLIFLAAALLAATAGAVQAHAGHELGGAVVGFLHPVGGLDHLLAMVGVGIWAAHVATRDRRAVWLVPAAFVAVMVLGGALAVAGLRLPMVEAGILGSVLLLGVILLAAPTLPVWAPMIAVGLFALFHGHAHGTEMPAAAAPLAYAAGFVLATAALHSLGIGIGIAARRLGGLAGTRALGGLVTLGGVALLAAG
ncbi:HupE/UreJ family protein [Vineibacter terrae]|uniref:HupE/UreJ family protein n=1 Tax=Vineibacter terrae TaxID=2586908 RepID=A0A5C8PDQ2_9HYPH|nr:HupE/UreJ family protein [Vineibacter terrae]TXL71452.1 HupE/UreJ family protein [Vineibacter terrae]